MFIGDDDPRLRTIVKYLKHPSILAVKINVKCKNLLYFSHVTLEEVLKEIGKLDFSKAAQETDTSTKNNEGKCIYICKFHISKFQ